MKINKYIVYIALAILAISLVGNYYFYTTIKDDNEKLNQSIGRNQILVEESLRHSIKIDSLMHVMKHRQDKVDSIEIILKSKQKITYYEKNRIANLPLDSAIIVFAKRYP